MIACAKRIAETKQSETIAIRRRISVSKQTTMKINGWGLTNCSFAIADAHDLTFKSSSFDMILCINLLHRVAEPARVILEAERLVKHNGFVAVSNSYDWSDEFTVRGNWFDDFTTMVRPEIWKLRSEIDGVTYLSELSIRKYTLAFNHVQIFQLVKQEASDEASN